MPSILLIGVATALVICAMMVKVFADQPKKANKSQKAEIMKQLLALSDHEKGISPRASTVRLQAPLSNRGTRSSASRKTATKISQPVRSK
jgi:hypothetical protein